MIKNIRTAILGQTSGPSNGLSHISLPPVSKGHLLELQIRRNCIGAHCRKDSSSGFHSLKPFSGQRILGAETSANSQKGTRDWRPHLSVCFSLPVVWHGLLEKPMLCFILFLIFFLFCLHSCALTGSVEEQWYLEILNKGRVTCPTCRAVVRKTVEGLKKHMANCRQEMFTCHHCGKQLRSLAGMKYHIMADHNNLPVVKEGGELDEPCERDRLRKVLKRMGKLKCMREVSWRPESLKEMTLEPSNAGRVQRKSAKVAVYYLHELANEELAKEWPKKKVLQDLVPDDRKLKYTRPGLPTFSQDVLCKWKSEIKMYRRVHCPNQGCESVYGSVSGLKSHLSTCTLGDFVAGKYKCLLCEKEFISESGVKYHINSVHAEDWFDVNTTNKKSFEKLMKIRQREDEQRKQRKKRTAARSRKKRPGTVSAKKLLGAGAERSRRRSKRGHSQLGDNESRSSEEEEEEPQAAQRAETPKTIRKRGRK
uniref:Zinc finger protein 512 n=1 Tax=Terrapene triunguis TaxID=2587831 RepID=A0A674IP23_9SAUR